MTAFVNHSYNNKFNILLIKTSFQTIKNRYLIKIIPRGNNILRSIYMNAYTGFNLEPENDNVGYSLRAKNLHLKLSKHLYNSQKLCAIFFKMNN